MNSKNVRYRIAVALAAVGMLVSAAQAAEFKIGFVNLDRTFEEYHKTRQANAQLKAQADEFKAERKRLIDEYKAIDAAYTTALDESENPALSEEARDKRRREADDKMLQKKDQERKIRQYDETKEKQLEDQTRRMRKKIIGEIKQALDAYAKVEGFTAVFDVSGDTLNGVPPVVSYDAKLDITDAFIPMLNRNAGAESEAAPAPAKGAKTK
jgi:outer membrane protein